MGSEQPRPIPPSPRPTGPLHRAQAPPTASLVGVGAAWSWVGVAGGGRGVTASGAGTFKGRIWPHPGCNRPGGETRRPCSALVLAVPYLATCVPERTVETQGALVGGWSRGSHGGGSCRGGGARGKGLAHLHEAGDDLCKQNTKSFWKWLNTEAGEGGQEIRGQLSPSALNAGSQGRRITVPMDVGSGTVEGRGVWGSPAPPLPLDTPTVPDPRLYTPRAFHFLARSTFLFFSKLVQAQTLTLLQLMVEQSGRGLPRGPPASTIPNPLALSLMA